VARLWADETVPQGLGDCVPRDSGLRSSEWRSARSLSGVNSLDSSVAIRGMRTLRQQIDESLHQDSATSALGAAASLLALVLTGVGLYGLVSFGVARRSGEIGIRMALGAQRGAVLESFCGRSLYLRRLESWRRFRWRGRLPG
jgi:hypothetical protein